MVSEDAYNGALLLETDLKVAQHGQRRPSWNLGQFLRALFNGSHRLGVIDWN